MEHLVPRQSWSDDDQGLRERLLKMPLTTLFDTGETSVVTRLSIGALSNRRALGMWPYPVKIPGAGRMIRYRHGDLLAPQDSADRRSEATAHHSTINP